MKCRYPLRPLYCKTVFIYLNQPFNRVRNESICPSIFYSSCVHLFITSQCLVNRRGGGLSGVTRDQQPLNARASYWPHCQPATMATRLGQTLQKARLERKPTSLRIVSIAVMLRGEALLGVFVPTQLGFPLVRV